MTLLLAGDVGGTSTRLGLFTPGPDRPRATAVRVFTTIAFENLDVLVRGFLRETDHTSADVTAACFGVAGPVVGRTAHLSNVPWTIDASALERDGGLARVR